MHGRSYVAESCTNFERTRAPPVSCFPHHDNWIPPALTVSISLERKMGGNSSSGSTPSPARSLPKRILPNRAGDPRTLHNVRRSLSIAVMF
ncbi:hypothetical protein M407DRAFT_242387 [Tulasnella calospora MUT 4182]|uniref:Uncharacterized protein n=1 Tax=Tulasnella calospora MUT 4182 TaxID=1051891 RepID=A0A0C3QQW7_9AGAM|nr:hypothetical protein M407DRAFT_242387 [Tulasnella calospora MUT 4182]